MGKVVHKSGVSPDAHCHKTAKGEACGEWPGDASGCILQEAGPGEAHLLLGSVCSFQFPIETVMLGFYFLDHNKHSWYVSANFFTQGPMGLFLFVILATFPSWCLSPVYIFFFFIVS